ncbi:Nitrilase family, member 2 [Seminavis robusta]|uniref:Nitrilase family, member 2 n=1 Tax=Seminavis robusta TaxID=568900 RepID=A0A9N8HMN5_9STRA|nr:Nitrilase family, member 2 [Seminavis robusta]|eukprot:Sro760_g198320.1 Nitrilase family, member 2 (296) ;mRNA; f:10934-11821
MNMQMPMSVSVPPMAMTTMSMNPTFNLSLDAFTQSLAAQSFANGNMANDAPMTLSSNTQANVVHDSSSSSQESSVPAFVAERKLLAPNFVPGPYDVICARGAAAANHPGNLRFRNTIKEFVPQYSKATTKLEKSLLVSAIVDSVRDYTVDGGFVKKFEDGNWYEVGDAACREKIGQTLRDQLHHMYKSSTKAKKPRRKELKALKKKAKQPAKKQTVVKKSKANNSKPLMAAQPSMTALLKSFPNNNNINLSLDTPMPALVNNKEQQDEPGELSLTNIFYSAFCDEGLNLDNGLRC